MAYKFKVGDAGLTSQGYAYRVICVDAKRANPIIALISWCDGEEVPQYFNSAGVGQCIKLLPPEPVKIKRTVWINVYRGRTDDECYVRESREDAERNRNPDCIATVPVPFEFHEGEGMED
jgi:hypothetical protein